MLNELNLTPELIGKAKSATSATALLAFAQENGITLTAEEATTYYSQLHPKEGALSDEELDNVSGGCGGDRENRKLAVDYARTNYCDRDQRCLIFQVKTEAKANVYRNLPRILEKLCPNCRCKPEIDAHCRSMGWQLLEYAPHMYDHS